MSCGISIWMRLCSLNAQACGRILQTTMSSRSPNAPAISPRCLRGKPCSRWLQAENRLDSRLGTLDGEPYLDQLSVRVGHMQRGLGTALIEAVARLAASTGARTLSLTTYAHLPWNKPFYERRGFETVPAAEWAPEIAGQISLQRKWLPFPDERVVMRKTLAALGPLRENEE